MATITKQGDRFRVRIRIHAKSISRTFPTKQEAVRWAKKAEGAILTGEWQDTPAVQVPTVARALDRYEAEVTPGKRSAQKEAYVIKALHQVGWLVRLRLDEVTHEHAARLRDSLASDGRAPSSVLRYLALLSHLFNVARIDWGFSTVKNPLEGIRRPKAGAGRERRISDDEFKAVVAASSSVELPLIATLALETAARRGELCKLLRQDVDLTGRTVRLRLTKNGKDRTIPLTPKAVATLAQALKMLPLREDGRVFGITPDALTRAWLRAVERARADYVATCVQNNVAPATGFLVGCRWHDLRHERTSRLFECGLTPPEIASITGHSGAAMVARYSHADPVKLAAKLATLAA